MTPAADSDSEIVMKFTLTASTALILFAGTAIGIPRPAAKTQSGPNVFARQAVTPDGTCGTQNGFRCSPTQNPCCSQWGWCGDGTEYCGE